MADDRMALPDVPPIEDRDIPDPVEAPDPDEDTRAFVPPDERPFTVLLFDPDSLRIGGAVIHATALVHLHAESPADAVDRARLEARSAARSTVAWRLPEALFVTEGYHLNVGPNALPRAT